MATKNTRDNTYYSLAKGFQFSSIISILAPVVLLVLTIVNQIISEKTGQPWGGYAMGMIVTGSIGLAFAAIWIVLSFVMFFTAGNLRGIKSPLGIRAGLIIAIIFVAAAEIVYVLRYASVIPADIGDTWNKVIDYGSQVLILIGYIIGAALSSSIKKALKA